MPASAVASAYSIGPDGRGGVGLGDGEGAAACSPGVVAAGATEFCCLQPENNTPRHSRVMEKRMQTFIDRVLLCAILCPLRLCGCSCSEHVTTATQRTQR